MEPTRRPAALARRRLAPGACWTLLLLSTALRPAQAATQYTFFHATDAHYVAGDNGANTAMIAKMNALPGTSYPGNRGTVQTPLGVIFTGDATNDNTGNAAEWAAWTADFGLNGAGGLLKYPVYEGYGNHDKGHVGGAVQWGIHNRNLTRLGVVHVSDQSKDDPRGVHYSWDWGPLHCVQLNIFAGNRDASNQPHYNPRNSIPFLIDDLTAQVGTSGRPVIVAQHLPPDSGEIHADDVAALTQAIAGYNVVGILYGHVGGTFAHGSFQGVDTFFPDDMPLGFLVFRVTDNGDGTGSVLWAQRKANDTWGPSGEYAIGVPPSVPEPSTLILLVGGPVAWALWRLRRRLTSRGRGDAANFTVTSGGGARPSTHYQKGNGL